MGLTSEGRQLQLAHAELALQREDFNRVVSGATEHMPHCWEEVYAGIQIATVVDYVRHLERGVGLHHPECDERCESKTCPVCGRKGL